MINPHDTFNIGLNINRAVKLFGVGDNDFRFIQSSGNTIVFPYKINCESILAGWLEWGNILNHYRDENCDIDKETRKWLETIFADVLSYLTVELEHHDSLDYPTAYVPELHMLIMNTHLQDVLSND